MAGALTPDGFPEFQQATNRVLFFSRGRGRGHAIPDIEILRALQAMDSGVEVRVVSYGLGADTFTDFGYPVIDLQLPDETPIAEMSVLAGRLIGWLKPDLVVAHEEFAVMPAAKIFDRSTLFITDFFTSAASYSMHALKFADRILFLSTDSVFELPPWLEGKVDYTGRILRDFRYGPSHQSEARAELGIAEDAFVILVSQGNWPENDAPLIGLMRGAFDLLNRDLKTIIWLAGQDCQLVSSHLDGRGCMVLERYWEIDRLMAAADVAITKSNRVTVFELNHLRVPTLALTWGLNPIDDQAISRLDGVYAYCAPALSPETLAEAIGKACEQPRIRTPRPHGSGATVCAKIICERLNSAG